MFSQAGNVTLNKLLYKVFSSNGIKMWFTNNAITFQSHKHINHKFKHSGASAKLTDHNLTILHK